MRKVPLHLENPIDNLIYDYMVEPLCDFFSLMNATPNIITTIKNLFVLFSIYCLYYKQTILSATTLLISYILDDVDGYYARKYNMTSKFGEKYDHYSDIILYGCEGLLLYIKYWNKYTTMLGRIWWLCFVLSCIIINQIHHSYYEKVAQGDSTITLLNHITIEKATERLKYFRWVGSGTLILVMGGM